MCSLFLAESLRIGVMEADPGKLFEPIECSLNVLERLILSGASIQEHRLD
jgi:hypothetical protein